MHVYEFTEPGASVTTKEVATPQPERHEVLLRITHAGVCHTDVHMRSGGYDLGSAGYLEVTSRGSSYPIVAGHEMVGDVVAVGDAVTTTQVGQRRLVFPWQGCRVCALCVSGDEHLCKASRAMGMRSQGGFAEMALVPHEDYLVDIDGVDPNLAATLACSGVTSYSAISKALPRDADTPLVVIGAGGVGLMAIAILVARGHRAIVAVDINDDRLRIAESLGATGTVNTTKGDPAQALLSLLGGPADAVVDFVNSAATAKLAFDSLGKNGRLVQVGLFGGDLVVPNAYVALMGITIGGSLVGSIDDLNELVEMARRNDLPRVPIRTEHLEPREIDNALDALEHGTVDGRIVLVA
ncbi:hypothetical protein ASD37_07485 [Mycobacterium sp. Root135]|uniref:alcohol dehydrogenase n=1 Tax=Mycobacterium sp. Root135 TaxID=1736457 RepID=UPI0006F3E099|nr:alcohol dehydrogenase [Mycobacterium sp. Root135]KQY07827.1 hypothetical protein ASD37_07485 [Mycobacterium sp. Root135]